MLNTFFTRIEANEKLGRSVRSITSLPSVPQGTEGTVVKKMRSQADNWRIRVEWRIPRPISLIDMGEFSFFKKERPTRTDLTKSEYQESVEEIT